MPVGAIPFPFGTCRICKDKATGIHYGVATCEGCKGFFKRSITRGDKYKCFFGNECDVTPKNRNRCKACRFKRCLDVGMSVEAVRMGRIPKIDKEKALEAFHQGGSDYSKLELEIESTGVGTYGFKINTASSSDEMLSEIEPSTSCESGLSLHSALTSSISVSNQTKPSSSVPVAQSEINNVSVLKSGENFAYPAVLPLDNSRLKDSSLLSGMQQSNNQVPHSASNHVGGSGVKHNRSCTVTTSTYQPMDYDRLGDTERTRSSKVGNVHSHQRNTHVSGNFLQSAAECYQENVAMNRETIVKQEGQQYPYFHAHGGEDNHRLGCNSGQFAQPSYHEAEMCSLSSGAPTARTNSMTMQEPVYAQTYNSRIASQSDHSRNKIQKQDEMFENSAKDLRVQQPSCKFSKSEMPQSNGHEQMQRLSSYDNNHYGNIPEHFGDQGNTNFFNRNNDNSFKGHSNNTKMTNSRLPPQAHGNDVNFQNSAGYYPQSYSGGTTNIGLSSSSGYSTVQSERDVNVFSPLSTQMSETGSHSIEAARCPTPVGSVISGAGSSSSQKSGFSPSIIQLLFEEVLKTCDGDIIKERLSEKLKKQNVDKNLIFRMLYLIEQSEKVQKGKQLLEMGDSDFNRQNLSALPESKEECMERFLHDLNSVKSCHSQDEVEKSMSTLDVKLSGAITNMLKGSPSKQMKLDSLNTVGSQLDATKCDSVTASTVQQEADNSRGLGIMSDTVSSSCVENKEREYLKKVKTTLVSMNLAQKILNRFKSEHREKIKLYLEGELFIKVLTDSEEDVKEVYSKLINGISGLNDRILGFSSHVPGFSSLCSEDQEKLVKRSYYDLWTLSYAEYFRDGKSYWILPSGEIYSAEAMRKILNDEMVDTIFKFAEKFNNLEVTDLEMGLLGAIRLTATDSLELNDMPAVESIHTHLLNTLAYEVTQNHPANHSRMLIDMFSLHPLLDAVNRIQKEIIANFSTKGFSQKDQK